MGSTEAKPQTDVPVATLSKDGFSRITDKLARQILMQRNRKLIPYAIGLIRRFLLRKKAHQ